MQAPSKGHLKKKKKKKHFIYLTETNGGWGEVGEMGEEEAGFLLSREPSAGLEPRTLRAEAEERGLITLA